MRLPSGRILLFLLALLLALPAHAQGQTGGVRGTIRDVTSSAPLGGIRVEAIAADGRTAGSDVTAQNGTYAISGLAPGSYALVISGTDIPVRRLDVTVRAGQTSRVDAQVSFGNVRLDPVVISASKRPEKATDAPARVEVVSEAQIQARPAVTPVDHLRSVPGVDVASTGIQSTNVVARGFNNIFSGSLHALTDNRIAGVPSLRVNFLHFVPSNNEDVARMEVVLGPGAALYGPNTANGILHIITRSPLDDQGTTVSFSGGTQELFQTEFRTAHLLTDDIGFKLSGQYMQASEFEYTDPAEAAEQARFRCVVDATGCTPQQIGAARFARTDLARAVGLDSLSAQARINRIGTRDFDVQRFAGEARLDWRMMPSMTTVFSAGMTDAASGIELTGLGASQVKDWKSSYYQARTTWNRLFAQVYLNRSDAGETYLLRNGAPIVDRSSLLVGQLQHGFSMWNERQNFTYGADYLHTTPVTEGTINGWYEDNDETTELGAYLQSETDLSERLELVLAGRVDSHSALPNPVFSPRAALVFKPREGHALRLSYNRAFSTPSSLNQFLDLGSAIPNAALAGLGYSLRIQGTGEEGFRFRGEDGSYQVRSPFTPTAMGGPAQLLPARSTELYPLAVGVLAANGAFNANPALGQYLSTLRPTAAQVGLNYLDVVTGVGGSLADLELNDIEPIRESISSTIEAGYKGLLANRLLIAADVWWSRREDLVTPLTIQTPLLLLNGPQLGAYLVPRFMADLGMSQAQATATATALLGRPATETAPAVPGLATIPVGVISSDDVDARGGQLLVTYVNVDETIDLWGTDVSATALVGNEWQLGASASFMSEDVFETESAGLVTLNAPKWKGTLTVDYDNDDTGLFGQVRMRYSDAFPVNSGVYVGTACLNEPGDPVPALQEACVDSYTLFDLNLGYRLPMVRGATLNVLVNNLLDADYRPFPGTPTIGRMLIARIRYDF
ncbi:MAG TPA: TonB-dependent receptor [Longimicrobium sp.]|jgi:iron complex outermembrane receptor protein|uniref:TonB-dependent receptor n=1 Tax=Longimicrobium sp. TaxID=2029185 RepID=UPI002ED84679